MTPDNRSYADARRNFADMPPLQFALREVQGHLRRPAFWIGLAAAIAILVVTGPSGTLHRYDAPGRLAYWGSVAFITFVTGLFFTILSVRLILPRIGARTAAVGIGAILAAIPITAEVWVANLVFSGRADTSFASIAAQFGLCAVISAGVATIYDMSARAPAAGPVAAPEPAPQEAPFLKRLPIGLGRDLISLQAQDHYLEVTTARGRDLILMRLGDAEKELEDYPGMRVHRSWWIARSAVAGIESGNDRTSVRLTNDVLVPVARSRRAALRKWLA